MKSRSQKIRFNLYGRFRVFSASGEDLTPKGTKSRGLLALMATESNFGRTRAWLQDKLWSDRGQDQAAASLRQALTEIRKSFGAHADVLISDRQNVALDADWIEIAAEQEGEFLEGLDVRDREFEEWLLVERARHANNTQSGGNPTGNLANSLSRRPIALVLKFPENPQFARTSNIFAEFTMRTLRENLMLNVLRVEENEIPKTGVLVLTVQAYPDGPEHFGISIWLEDLEGRGTLWSSSRKGLKLEDETLTDASLVGLVTQISEAVADASAGYHLNLPFDRDANLLANLAVRKLFSIKQSELEAADTLLTQAYEIEPQGVFQAWLAQIYTIQFVERYETDIAVAREKSEAACAAALAADTVNSNVLAAVANSKMILDQDYLGGGELAKTSVKLNPSNPLAWWSLSNAHLHAEEYELGYLCAVQAQQLAEGTRLKFWGDFQRSLTAAIVNNPQEALRFGASPNALAPDFRPALRYLTVLNAASGSDKQTQFYIDRLERLEPDFTIERLVKDKDYPAKFLHKAGLLNAGGIVDWL